MFEQRPEAHTPAQAVPPAAQPYLQEDILRAAQELARQDANVIFEINERAGAPVFRRGGIRLNVPESVTLGLAACLPQTDRQALLIALRRPTVAAVQGFLGSVLNGGRGWADAAAEHGLQLSLSPQRILLVPPYGDREGQPLKYILPHYGVETLAFRLRRETERCDAQVYNPNLGSRGELFAFIRREQPQMLGFSLLMLSLAESARMIAKAHTVSPDSLIVVGGGDLRAFPPEALAEFFAAVPCDVAVLDDGSSFIEIARRLERVKKNCPCRDASRYPEPGAADSAGSPADGRRMEG